LLLGFFCGSFLITSSPGFTSLYLDGVSTKWWGTSKTGWAPYPHTVIPWNDAEAARINGGREVRLPAVGTALANEFHGRFALCTDSSKNLVWPAALDKQSKNKVVEHLESGACTAEPAPENGEEVATRWKKMQELKGARDAILLHDFSRGKGLTYAQVAREAQIGLQSAGVAETTTALVMLTNARVDHVADEKNPKDHPGPLRLLTAVVDKASFRDADKYGQEVVGVKSEAPRQGYLSMLARYLLVSVFWVLWTSVTYAFSSPLVNVLTLRTTPAVKIKSKSWSNSFGNNVLKAMGLCANTINMPLFSLNGTMLLGFIWVCLWVVSLFWLVAVYERLEETDTYVGDGETSKANNLNPSTIAATTVAQPALLQGNSSTAYTKVADDEESRALLQEPQGEKRD